MNEILAKKIARTGHEQIQDLQGIMFVVFAARVLCFWQTMVYVHLFAKKSQNLTCSTPLAANRTPNRTPISM
jgi:phage-related protein